MKKAVALFIPTHFMVTKLIVCTLVFHMHIHMLRYIAKTRVMFDRHGIELNRVVHDGDLMNIL